MLEILHNSMIIDSENFAALGMFLKSRPHLNQGVDEIPVTAKTKNPCQAEKSLTLRVGCGRS
jgi:hypothetical protein